MDIRYLSQKLSQFQRCFRFLHDKFWTNFLVYNVIKHYRGDDKNGIARVERKKRRDLFGIPQ